MVALDNHRASLEATLGVMPWVWLMVGRSEVVAGVGWRKPSHGRVSVNRV